MSILTQGISTIVILMGLFMCVFVDWHHVCENCCFHQEAVTIAPLNGEGKAYYVI